MEDCKSISSPMERNVSTVLRNDSELATNVSYRVAIGSFLYFAMCTRPDIAYSVSILLQYCETPTITHWKMVKPIFRYMQGTIEVALIYIGKRADHVECRFVGFSDSDWAGLSFRKSTSCSSLFYNDFLVMWKSCKQRIVAHSTTKAELVALVEAFKQQKANQKMMGETNHVDGPWTITCDNQETISIVKDTGYS